MKVIFSQMCIDDNRKFAYAISPIDDKIYKCDMFKKTCVAIFKLPKLYRYDKWFTLTYCREMLFITSRRDRKIYCLDLKKNVLETVQYKNELQSSSMGIFSYSYKKYIYFFQRMSTRVLKISADTLEVSEIVVSKDRQFKVIENMSAWENNLVLYNFTERKYLVFNLDSDRIEYKGELESKYHSFLNKKAEIYLAGKDMLYIMDFSGEELMHVRYPSSKSRFFIIHYGRSIAIFNQEGELYILSEKNEFSSQSIQIEGQRMNTDMGEDILSKISFGNEIGMKYYIYDAVFKQYVENSFELTDLESKIQYKNNFKESAVYLNEGGDGAFYLKDFMRFLYYN